MVGSEIAATPTPDTGGSDDDDERTPREKALAVTFTLVGVVVTLGAGYLLATL